MILLKVNPTDRFCYLGWSIARLRNLSVAERERGSRNPAFANRGAAEVVVCKRIVKPVIPIPLENGSTR